MWAGEAGYSQRIWARNDGCYRVPRVMFSGRYNYRLICDLQDGALRVLVLEVAHRKDVYRG